jgi:hypothetical protein
MHQRAQARLRDATAGAVAGILGAITLDRTQTVRDGYALATSRVVSGGQMQAATWGAALIGAYRQPLERPDVVGALGDRLMTPEDGGAIVGLLRMWSLLDDGTVEQDARLEAGSYAASLADSDLAMAARVGQDEGLRVAHVGRVMWGLDATDSNCDWCQMIASTGYRYHEATTVPFHGQCKCAVDFTEIGTNEE